MRYEVLRFDSYFDLEKKVNEKLKQGWKLQGGVSITSHGMSIYCSQAMVKDWSGKMNYKECKCCGRPVMEILLNKDGLCSVCF